MNSFRKEFQNQIPPLTELHGIVAIRHRACPSGVVVRSANDVRLPGHVLMHDPNRVHVLHMHQIMSCNVSSGCDTVQKMSYCALSQRNYAPLRKPPSLRSVLISSSIPCHPGTLLCKSNLIAVCTVNFCAFCERFHQTFTRFQKNMS